MAVADHPIANGLRCLLEYIGLGSRIAPFPIRRQARPWTLNEIPPAPADWSPAPPDYVGIGTQKAGTSWWASLIEQHPQVVPTRFDRKEMHYFTHFLDRPLLAEDVATYHAAFARPDGMRCGEWTPNYLANPYCLPRIQSAAPQAKILVMVRNPIDRFDSGFNHESRMRFGAVMGPRIRTTVIKKYALRTESIWTGMYGAQMDIVERTFPREQVLLLQYERCRAEPREMIARTYQFLGIDDAYVPEAMEKPVNPQRRVVPLLSDEGKAMLAEIYAEDVKHLLAKFPDEIDLSLWSPFEV